MISMQSDQRGFHDENIAPLLESEGGIEQFERTHLPCTIGTDSRSYLSFNSFHAPRAVESKLQLRPSKTLN